MYFGCCCNGDGKWSDGPFKHLLHNKQIIIIFNDEWNIIGCTTIVPRLRCDHENKIKIIVMS